MNNHEVLVEEAMNNQLTCTAPCWWSVSASIARDRGICHHFIALQQLVSCFWCYDAILDVLRRHLRDGYNIILFEARKKHSAADPRRLSREPAIRRRESSTFAAVAGAECGPFYTGKAQTQYSGQST